MKDEGLPGAADFLGEFRSWKDPCDAFVVREHVTAFRVAKRFFSAADFGSSGFRLRGLCFAL